MTQAEGINRLKLSQVRPGMPIAALIEAFGSKWKAPPSKSLGWLWGKDYGVHFNGRITMDERVGEVSFPAKFPSKYEIEKLRIDMKLVDALAAQPTLRLESEDATHQDRAYVTTLPSGVALRASFRKEQLNLIALSHPNAQYYDQTTRPLPDARRYPTPHGEPGFPFADPNLKFWTLNELQFAEASIDLGEPEDLVAHVMQRYVDLEDQGYDRIPQVYDYLARYPVTDQMLSRIEALGADPASNVYRCIRYHWDGESGEFDVQSLVGIGHCSHLKSLHLEHMCAGSLDLAPLRDLHSLEKISLDLRRDRFTNLAVLAELPKLAEVVGYDHRDNDKAVIAALKLKGIKLTL